MSITGDARVDKLELAAWDRLIATNLTGMFLTCKHAVRLIEASGGGSIVVIGSPTGLYGFAFGEHGYSASKGGVHALARVMAGELAALGIRVNIVVPGFIDTPMNAHVVADAELMADAEQLIPLRRIGQPSEVAGHDLLADLARTQVTRQAATSRSTEDRCVYRRTADGSRHAAWGQASTWTDAALSDDTGVPLYIQIRNLLRERIRLGEWAAEEPMPTEEELVAHFGVSRTTVRQAMSDLANEGLVVRHAGRGTFARQPLMVVRDAAMAQPDDRHRAARPAAVEEGSAGREARRAGRDRAPRLGAGRGRHPPHPVGPLRGRVPIVVLDNYFPFELCGFLTEVELDAPDNSIEHALAEHGIELSRAERRDLGGGRDQAGGQASRHQAGGAGGRDRDEDLQRGRPGRRVLARGRRQRALPPGDVQRLERRNRGDHHTAVNTAMRGSEDECSSPSDRRH